MILTEWLRIKDRPQKLPVGVVELTPTEIAALDLFREHDPDNAQRYSLLHIQTDAEKMRAMSTDAAQLLVIEAPEPNAEYRECLIAIPAINEERHGKFPNVEPILEQAKTRGVLFDLGRLQRLVQALSLITTERYDLQKVRISQAENNGPWFFEVQTQRAKATAVLMPLSDD